MTHLYEITKELQELQQLIADSENPEQSLIEAFNDTLEATQLSFQDKAQNVVLFMKNVGANLDSIEAEISRLQAKKKSIENKQDWFKDYLRSNMSSAGISRIECPLFTITLSKPQSMVEITDESMLPASVKTAVTTVKIDKTALKKMLENSEDIHGARLVDATPRLLIK